MSGSNTISNFKFLYIPGPGEECPVAASPPQVPTEITVHGPVVRPITQPMISAVTGIRSNFCFRVLAGERLAFRRFSCHCDSCLNSQWDECKCEGVGVWTVLQMTKIAGNSPQRLRSERDRVSTIRRELAQLCKAGEFVAMESKDDEDGFSFWLARVKGPAFQHSGRQEYKDGVQLKKNGWYVTITIFDRFPASSSSTFQSCQAEWTVDAEGLVVREVCVQQTENMHRTRSPKSTAELVRMSDEEVKRIDTLCAVRLN